METKVINNNYICDADMLKSAYLAMHETMKKFEEKGTYVEPYLADYLIDGNLKYFTEGNKDYINARKIMSNINIETLKREVLALLYAYGQYGIHFTRTYNKKTGEFGGSLDDKIRDLFYYADENNIDILFNRLYRSFPKQLNSLIDEALNRLLNQVKKIEKSPSKPSWVRKDYFEYDEELKTINNIRKGKYTASYFPKIVNIPQRKLKKLEKDYGRTY